MRNIAIVGGGIVGATAAYQLTKKGYQVTLFDQGVGKATTAAAGIVCPWLSQRRNQDWYRLTSAGAAYYPYLMQQMEADGIEDLAYQQIGALVFKKSQVLLDKLVQIANSRKVDAPMMGHLVPKTPQEVAQMIPGWAGDQGALWCSGGGRVDGKKLIDQLLQLAEKRGAKIIDQEVSLLVEKQKLKLVLQGTPLAFDQVILASGAWLGPLLRPLGYEVDVRPQKGQLIEIQLPAGIDTSTWPVCMLHGEVDFLPFPNGKIIVGATHENEQGYDLKDDEALQQAMFEEACQVYPGLKEAAITGTRIGTRAYSSDFSPFFGKLPDLGPVFVASGLGSSGLTSGAFIGQLLSQMVDGQEIAFEIQAYDPKKYIQKPDKFLEN